MSTLLRYTQELKQRAERGAVGYPVATVSYFGPDDHLATKVAVAILPDKSFRPSTRVSWTSQGSDLRNDEDVNKQILRVIEDHGAETVVMRDKILGCPHEEGVRIAEGFVCSDCAFWAKRRRQRKVRILLKMTGDSG